MKNSELCELTLNELRTRKRELREEIFKLRLQQQGGQLERPSMLQTLRRNVARIETVVSKKSKTANKIASK